MSQCAHPVVSVAPQGARSILRYRCNECGRDDFALVAPDKDQRLITTRADRTAVLRAFIAATAHLTVHEIRLAGRTTRTHRRGRMEITEDKWKSCFLSGWAPDRWFYFMSCVTERIGDDDARLAVLNQPDNPSMQTEDWGL